MSIDVASFETSTPDDENKENVFECFHDNSLDIKKSHSKDDIYSNPFGDEETFKNTFLNNNNVLKTGEVARMKRKSYAGCSRINEPDKTNGKDKDSQSRKFSLGTVLRKISTNSLFQRDNNLDKQMNSDSDFEDDDSLYQGDSTSWEFISNIDEKNNVQLRSCFKTKYPHEDKLATSEKINQYNCDSGISTLE